MGFTILSPSLMLCLAKLYQSVAEFLVEFRGPKHPYQDFGNIKNKPEHLAS